jgi:hypothetical protein
MNRVLRDALVCAALAASWPIAAQAQLVVGRQVTVIQTVATSAYLNGGVGLDEQAAMRSVAKAFPLRIVFSENKNRQFLADIPMVIANSSGNAIFELRAAGPMLYVMLPQGRYKVSARYKGVIQTHEVMLAGKDGKDVNFHWEGNLRESPPLESPQSAGRVIAALFGGERMPLSDDQALIAAKPAGQRAVRDIDGR